MTVKPIVYIGAKHIRLNEALADLTVSWGKTDLQSQPSPSQASLKVFADDISKIWWLKLGLPLRVLLSEGSYALKDVPASDFSQGFVSISDKGATYRKQSTESYITVENVTDRVIEIIILPSAPSPNPTAWDAHEVFQEQNKQYTSVSAVKSKMGWEDYKATFQALTIATPSSTPTPYGATQTLTNNSRSVELVGETGKYLGVKITIERLSEFTWAEQKKYWYAMNMTWADLNSPVSLSIGDFYHLYTKSADSSIFEGTITEVSLQKLNGNVVATCSAADKWTQLANTRIGAKPWPQEPATTRASHIFDAIPGNFPYDFPPSCTQIIAPRDIDSQPATDIIQSLAYSCGLDAWPASHETAGFYVKFAPIAPSPNKDDILYLNGGAFLDNVEARKDWKAFSTSITVRYKDPSDPDGEDPSNTIVLTNEQADYGRKDLAISTELVNPEDISYLQNCWSAVLNKKVWNLDGLTLYGLTTPETPQKALLDALKRQNAFISLAKTGFLKSSFLLRVIGGEYTYNGNYWQLKLNTITQEI